jgi:hypothetical protein
MDDQIGPASDDKIERWGKRIGRALGWIAIAFLIFQLMRMYGT